MKLYIFFFRSSHLILENYLEEQRAKNNQGIPEEILGERLLSFQIF